MTTTAAADPVEALDLSVDDSVTVETELPASSVLGANESTPIEPEKEPEAAAEPTLPEGYTRDSLGRVRDTKTGHVVAKDKVAELLATASQQPVATEEVKPSPFQYRAFGETKTADGFEQHADGSVRVAPEQVSELRFLLNAKHALSQESEYVNAVKAENEGLKAEIEQYRQGSSAEIAKADALSNALTRALQEPDEAKALEWFFMMREKHPVLLARAEAEHYKRLATKGKPEARETQEPERAAVPTLPAREAAAAVTQDHIERIKLEHQYRDLTDADWKQFGTQRERTPYAYIRPATPEEAKRLNVREGSSVFDDVALAEDVKEYAAAQRKSRETVTSQATLAAKNATRTQPSIDAPPTAAGGPTPSKPRREIKTEKDWDEYMNSDEI